MVSLAASRENGKALLPQPDFITHDKYLIFSKPNGVDAIHSFDNLLFLRLPERIFSADFGLSHRNVADDATFSRSNNEKFYVLENEVRDKKYKSEYFSCLLAVLAPRIYLPSGICAPSYNDAII